jgi:hypothetical protein
MLETNKMHASFFIKVLQPKWNCYRFVQSGPGSLSALGYVEEACRKSREVDEMFHGDCLHMGWA